MTLKTTKYEYSPSLTPSPSTAMLQFGTQAQILPHHYYSTHVYSLMYSSALKCSTSGSPSSIRISLLMPSCDHPNLPCVNIPHQRNAHTVHCTTLCSCCKSPPPTHRIPLSNSIALLHTSIEQFPAPFSQQL